MIVIERIATDKTAHRITSGAHELITDMALAEGGADEGPNPHDLYDAALGACKALTMLWYARRNGIALETVRVGVERDASAERDGLYKLTARIAIDGPMSAEERARLIAVAGKCPVHKLMTQVETQIETITVEPAR
ncbi:MAG TPA: OsmC family protein [Sphingobium sp.]|nr:OsmC family protein [Sphingobium sp.]